MQTYGRAKRNPSKPPAVILDHAGRQVWPRGLWSLDRLLADQMPTPPWVHARAQEPAPMIRYDVGGALREVAALPVVPAWVAPEMRGHGFSQPVALAPNHFPDPLDVVNGFPFLAFLSVTMLGLAVVAITGAL